MNQLKKMQVFVELSILCLVIHICLMYVLVFIDNFTLKYQISKGRQSL